MQEHQQKNFKPNILPAVDLPGGGVSTVESNSADQPDQKG